MAPTPGALVREARGCPSRSVSILRAPQTSPARRGRHALELPPTPASPRLGHRGKGRSPPEAHVQPEPLPPRPSSPAAAWLRRPPCWTPRLPWAPARHVPRGPLSTQRPAPLSRPVASPRPLSVFEAPGVSTWNVAQTKHAPPLGGHVAWPPPAAAASPDTVFLLLLPDRAWALKIGKRRLCVLF